MLKKGGVGKTTNCLALAFGFAKKGLRVLIYDCDVQRSLTAWAFGINIEFSHGNTVNKVDNFIRNLPAPEGMHKTLFEQVDAKTSDVEPAFATSICENIYVVAGDRQTPKLDSIILHIETFCKQVQGSVSNNRTARPYHAIMKTAEWYKADYVFLDLNPYPSILNRCLIMSSNYILIPLCLDAFCLEMLNMMESNLTNWKIEIDSVKPFINMTGNNMTWPEHLPKFLGYLINDLMVYKDIIRNNEIYLGKEIGKQANSLTRKLGDNRTKNPLAITSKQYNETETIVSWSGNEISWTGRYFEYISFTSALFK